VTLTTSPYEVKTHWKHTFFYLEKPLTVSGGEYINGYIAVRKNKKNPRAIDVLINSKVGDKPWEERGRKETAKVYFVA
jgi:hypothetical protein